VANTLLTPQMITREALRILHQKLQFIGKVNRQYDDRFAQSGGKIGATLNIRKPARYTVSSGPNLSVQDSTESFVPLTVTNQKHVDMSFSSFELTMQIDDFSKRFIEPAVTQLASYIENDVIQNVYKSVWSQVGTPNAPLNALRPFLQARQRMNNNLAPQDGQRTMMINTDTEVESVDALKGLFQSSAQIKQQYEDGMMGRTAGFDWRANTLLPNQLPGTFAGTPLVNGAGQTGATLVTNGWTANTVGLQVGDIFTIAGVYGVHRETRQAFGYPQQFVVTALGTADGAGNMTVGISPSIITTGAFQTVTVSPAAGAALTFAGTASTPYGINLAFHKDAFTFATADLVDVSKEGAWGARETFEGISMRIARQYAIGTDTVPTRIDVLYGSACLYPELACRVANQPATS
jgi:hypothetical protein